MATFKEDFQKNTHFDKRLYESSRLKTKYHDRVCVIVSKSNNCSKDISDIDKHKYLVPKSITVGQFVYIIRKRIEIDPSKAIFIFVNDGKHDILPPTSGSLDELYEQYKESDGFLYITFSGESTFG